MRIVVAPEAVVRGGRNRSRKVARAPIMTPFFSFGDTWRGDHHLEGRGWYFVEPKGFLHGPFPSRTGAATICLRVDLAIENETKVTA